jgi:hypothetical protein
MTRTAVSVPAAPETGKTSMRLRCVRCLILALTISSSAYGQSGTASGTVTIDGIATSLAHAVFTTRTNVFDETTPDPLIVISNHPLTVDEAADDGLLAEMSRGGDLVMMAVRFDGRPGRGLPLFNIGLRYTGAPGPVLLPDVYFKVTFKDGAGTVLMPSREFAGHTYAAKLEYAVKIPKEVTEALTAKAAPTAEFTLPPPSQTAADRRAAATLLIDVLQEGDEAKALAVLALGVDPDVADEKMKIPLINWALLMCQPLIVKGLVELKADLSHERLPGMTLLGEAAAACPDAVPFLKAGGAK